MCSTKILSADAPNFVTSSEDFNNCCNLLVGKADSVQMYAAPFQGFDIASQSRLPNLRKEFCKRLRNYEIFTIFNCNVFFFCLSKYGSLRKIGKNAYQPRSLPVVWKFERRDTAVKRIVFFLCLLRRKFVLFLAEKCPLSAQHPVFYSRSSKIFRF